MYDYDALNREIKKTIPVPANGSQNVYTTYDLLNLKTSARFGSANGAGIIYIYSGFGEVIRESSSVSGNTYSVSNHYDKHNNRTAVIHNDNATFTYIYDGLDRNTHIREGNSSGSVLITNGADNFARPQSQTTAGNAITSITYDSLSRPDSIGWSLSTTAYNAKHTFGFNPVGQIVQQDFTNDLFQYKEAGSKVGSYAVNNLNQYTSVGLQVYGYDKNGNLICDGMYNETSNVCTLGTRYTYDVENRLTSLSGDKNATLKYDPAGRLYQITANDTTTNFHYNGDQMIGEFSGPTLLKRYVFSVGVDKPTIAYTNNQIAANTRQFLHSNHQGSIVMASNSSGNMQYVNTYDGYGVPGKVNQGRFGYTGQMNLPEIGLYYYKARIYYPQIGRFLQTDPIGYKGDYNLYAYVGNDPVNNNDPSGMFCIPCVGAVVGGVAGAIAYAATTDNVTAAGMASAIGTGAVVGALTSVGAGAIAASGMSATATGASVVGAGTVIGAAGEAANQMVASGGSITDGKAVGIAGVANGIGALAAGAASKPIAAGISKAISTPSSQGTGVPIRSLSGKVFPPIGSSPGKVIPAPAAAVTSAAESAGGVTASATAVATTCSDKSKCN